MRRGFVQQRTRFFDDLRLFRNREVVEGIGGVIYVKGVKGDQPGRCDSHEKQTQRKEEQQEGNKRSPD
jgi:hypothetical protein